jgi:hypothetical protein
MFEYLDDQYFPRETLRLISKRDGTAVPSTEIMRVDVEC